MLLLVVLISLISIHF